MKTTKKRTRIEDIRRVEMIEAAHRVFLEHGLGGMTTARICAEAGMSPGILAYYFKGKDEVLFGMVRYNNRILMEDVIVRLRAATSAWGRLEAIVEGNFPESAFTSVIASAWLSICAEAGANARYGRLQTLFHRRLGSNLGATFRGLLDPGRVRHLSLSLAGLIDGLWLRKAVSDDLSRDEAVAVVLRCLTTLITPEEQEALKAARTEVGA